MLLAVLRIASYHDDFRLSLQTADEALFLLKVPA